MDITVIVGQRVAYCVLQANGQIQVLQNAEYVAPGLILPKDLHRAVLVQKIRFLTLVVSIVSRVQMHRYLHIVL